MTLSHQETINEGLNCLFHNYVIVGDPIPLARHRHGNGHTYDSQKDLKWQYGLQLQAQHTTKTFFKGPIHVDFRFFFSVPKTSKTARNKGYHIYKPDLSNLIKFIEDVATGILYKDDCVISTFSATKKYCHSPRTEFTISELKS